MSAFCLESAVAALVECQSDAEIRNIEKMLTQPFKKVPKLANQNKNHRTSMTFLDINLILCHSLMFVSGLKLFPGPIKGLSIIHST